jgi:hypothetical protein
MCNVVTERRVVLITLSPVYKKDAGLQGSSMSKKHILFYFFRVVLPHGQETGISRHKVTINSEHIGALLS